MVLRLSINFDLDRFTPMAVGTTSSTDETSHPLRIEPRRCYEMFRFLVKAVVVISAGCLGIIIG